MTRPLDRHLDNAEIDALVSMSTAGNGGSVGLSGEDVQQCQRHAESCEDCGYKVRMHEHAQADFARLRPAGFVESSARCPEAAAWLQVAAGLLGETRARELMTHAAQCDHCGPMLRDAVATVADESTGEEEQIVATLRSSHGKWQGLSRDPSQGSPARLQVQRWWTSPTIWLRWEIAVGLLALVMAAAWWSFRSFEMNSPDRLLAAAYTERRTLEMRTEGARYAPLRQTRGADRSQSRMEQPTSLLDAEALVARNLKSHPEDPHWLHAQGLADLLEGNYEAAIPTLEKARQFAPDIPAISLDLATAYFVRAENLNRPEDYGTAVDVLGRIVAAHPEDSVALFNYAIALEKVFLYQQAVSNWQAFLHLDPDSKWAGEARSHLASVEEKIRQQESRSEGSMKDPSGFVAALASAEDKQVREIDERSERYLQVAVEQWLPDAFRANHHTSQTARRAVEKLATLMRARHGDTWLRDVLLESRASKQDVSTALLRLAEAARLNHTSDRDHARHSALEAARLFQEAQVPAGNLRAQFEVIYADQLVHRNGDCYGAAQKLMESHRLSSYAWLHTQVLLETAVCASMSDERALTLCSAVLELAQRHRFPLLEMRAVTLLASLSWSVGNAANAWRYSAEGLGRYWEGDFPYKFGYNLYTNLDYLADDDQRWFLQSFSVLREAVRMVQNSPDIVLRALEQARLSEALLMTGDLSGAESSLQQTRSLFADSPSGSRKQNLTAEAEIGLANVELRRGEAASAVRRLKKIRGIITRPR